MMTKSQSNNCTYGKALLTFCTLAFVLGSSFLFAAEQKDTSELPRYIVRSLKHISPAQGKKYLKELKLGTVSQLPNSNTLLVTAPRAQLSKASAILKLVDAEQPFVVRTVCPATQFENLPSIQRISAEVGNISIGTFSNPPTGPSPVKAIIDIHQDQVLAVAPKDTIEKIIAAIEKLQKTTNPVDVLSSVESAKQISPNQPPKTQLPIRIEPSAQEPIARTELLTATVPQEVNSVTDTNKAESDELFNHLLRSLEEAQADADQVRALTADTNLIEIEPFVEHEERQTREADTTAQPSEPGLAAILERLEAIEVAVKEATARPEQRAVDITEPAQTAEPARLIPRDYEPEPIADGNESLSLDLPEKVSIVDFLGLVGEELQLDYLYNPDEVKGDVTLKFQGKYRGKAKRKDLYPLLEQVMKFKGLAMTRRGNLVTIVPIAKIKEVDPVFLRAEDVRLEHGDVIVTSVFKLKHIDTTSAMNLLKRMGLGVDIEPVAETRTLIVTGYAYRMQRIEQLLEMVDQPGKPKKFRFRQLKYTMAETLAPKVKALAEQLGTISISIGAPPPTTTKKQTPRARAKAKKPPPAAQKAAESTVYLDADERTNRVLMIGLDEQLDIIEELIDSLDVRQQDLRALRLYEIQYVGADDVKEKLEELGIIGRSQAPARRRTRTTRAKGAKGAQLPAAVSTKEPLTEDPQVVVIESTNSLLVNATDEQHNQIATIISYVDAEPEEAAINYIVYPLENQDPERLGQILLDLIQETVFEQRDKDDKVVKTTTSKIEDIISIVSDPNTYSLIVYASKKNQLWISSLIKQLDDYRPQVLLDVTLVEIQKNDEFNYDLNLISSFPNLLNTSGLTGTIIPGAGAIPPFTSDDIVDQLNSIGRDRFIDLQSFSGEGTAFYGDRHINLLLTAVQDKGYGRILARPKLLVNDNENGIIETQETTYRTRTETVVQTTSGEPITSRNVVFDSFDSGITLDIRPHISKGDQLRLQIELTRSDFRDTLASLRLVDPTPPDKITRNVRTIVTVPDNTTIILGGLETLTQSKGGSKVPLLGDLPLIGGLFRSIANTDEQSRLYIFVKAHILRPGEGLADVKMVSKKNRDSFERYEKEMQEYEDWPGIKPTPMDPLKILEED